MNNSAAHRTQKIDMAMIDYLLVMVKCLVTAFSEGARVGTEDMKGAYRQAPLPDSQVGVSITAVYDPSSDSCKLFEIFSQPFGAEHAVPNFYRMAEWLAPWNQVDGFHARPLLRRLNSSMQPGRLNLSQPGSVCWNCSHFVVFILTPERVKHPPQSQRF